MNKLMKTIEEIAEELYPAEDFCHPILGKFTIDGKEKRLAFVKGYIFAKSTQPEPEKGGHNYEGSELLIPFGGINKRLKETLELIKKTNKMQQNTEQPEPEKPTEPKFRVVEPWKDCFFIEQLIDGNFKRFDTFYYSLKSAKAAISELKAKAIEDAKYPIIHEVD